MPSSRCEITHTRAGRVSRSKVVEAVGVATHPKEESDFPRMAGDVERSVVEAVGIEPTSGRRVPQVSTSVAFVSGHRPDGWQKAACRRRQSRFDDPGAVRDQPRRSVHFGVASHPAVDRAVVRDVAVN